MSWMPAGRLAGDCRCQFGGQDGGATSGLPAQGVTALSFAPGPKRFVTIDAARMAVTVWDAVGLTAVATLRAGQGDREVRRVAG